MAHLSPTALSIFYVLANLVGVAQGSAFRGGGLASATGHMSVEKLRTVMLDELMGALGSSNHVTEQRLAKIEEALRPTFLSLPKNAYGNLDHAAVRYALHRLFVLRHGMYVKGLEPGGEAWNGTASPTEVLDDKVPTYVQALFEQRLNGHGLGIHEMAILAATLEHLIHDEAVERLRASYQVHGLPIEQPLDEKKVEGVIDTYMVVFLLGKNVTSMTPDDIQAEEADILSVYPAWPESQKFTRDVQQSVTAANKADPSFAPGKLAFTAMSQIIEEIGERYGKWQDSECHDLKAALIKLEEPGTGRVLLKNFYSNALDGAWQFTESVQYLKELGALDETDPQRKSVIIPNYINSPSNCLASSSVYSVCCLNECESLLGHLEKEIGEPDGTVAKVLELVSNLPSTTETAPRTLSPELIRLLNDVASHHDGRVPLHGRLFGQWIHHAFPRECPYPHKAGTTKPMSADDWMDEKGVDALSASEDEMQHHVTDPPSEDTVTIGAGAVGGGPNNTASKSLMWTMEEELIVSTTAVPSRSRGRGWSVFSFGGVLIGLVGIMKNFGPAISAALKGKDMLPMHKSHYC